MVFGLGCGNGTGVCGRCGGRRAVRGGHWRTSRKVLAEPFGLEPAAEPLQAWRGKNVARGRDAYAMTRIAPQSSHQFVAALDERCLRNRFRVHASFMLAVPGRDRFQGELIAGPKEREPNVWFGATVIGRVVIRGGRVVIDGERIALKRERQRFTDVPARPSCLHREDNFVVEPHDGPASAEDRKSMDRFRLNFQQPAPLNFRRSWGRRQ